MFSLKDRIKEILLRDKLIKPEDLDRAVAEQKRTGEALGKILVQLKLISEDDLTMLLSESLGLPPIDISRLKIDPSVVKIIPQAIAVKYQVMPISKMGDQLTLAMSDPLNIFAIDSVVALTGLRITPIIGRVSDIMKAVQTYYAQVVPEPGQETETTEKFEEIMKDIKDAEEMELIKEAATEMDKSTIENLSQEAPIIKLTDVIIKQAVLAKASDVFIEPLEKSLRIRYRIDGIIREIDQMSKVLHFPIVSRIKVISTLDISEHRLPQDGRFRTIIDGDKEVDFRVSVLPTIQGEKVVLRILDKNAGMLDLVKLGYTKEDLARIKECSQRPHGMILACGPTGSGKTTTLYSILKFVDSPGKNIVTVEDPVEFQVKGINQVNVRPGVGLTFAAALRSILRQDPDIILIGEIRDTETLDIAVKAALTGHLVLSSLHTTTAAGSIIRMMNMGTEPFLICSSTIAVLAQRLIRKVCSHCKEEYKLTREVMEKMNLGRLVQSADTKFYRGKGCKTCFNTGYAGRLGISEILVLTPKVKELILARAGEYKIKEAGRQEGMITMREDAVGKALEGLTSLEEVLRVTAPDEKV